MAPIRYINQTPFMDARLQQRQRARRNRIVLAACIACYAGALYHHWANFDHEPRRRRQHNSKISGGEWMEELLEKHPERTKKYLGVSKTGFLYLEELLCHKTSFASTRYMGTKEQLGISLYAVVTELPMRKLAERFQRSTETIQRTYHKVMRLFSTPEIYHAYSRVTFARLTALTPVPPMP